MESTIINETHDIKLTQSNEFVEITKRGFHLFYWSSEELEDGATYGAMKAAIQMCKKFPMHAIDITTKGIVFNHSDLDIEDLLLQQTALETPEQRMAIEKCFEEQFADINPFAIDVEDNSYWYETDVLRDNDWEQLCWLLTINSKFHKYSIK